MTIQIEEVNKVLANLHNNTYLIDTRKGYQGIPNDYSDGMQGEYNETIKIFRTDKFPEGYALVCKYHTDSYGDNESLESCQLLKGKEKSIIIYEH